MVYCRGIGTIFGECNPPLGLRPNCFPDSTELYMVGTDACANAVSDVYNITGDPLKEIGRINRGINAECAKIASAVRSQEILPPVQSTLRYCEEQTVLCADGRYKSYVADASL